LPLPLPLVWGLALLLRRLGPAVGDDALDLAGLGDRLLLFAPSAALWILRAALACALSRAALRLRCFSLSAAVIFGAKARRPRRASAEPSLMAKVWLLITASSRGGGVWAAFLPMSGAGVLLRAEACPRGPAWLPVLLLRDDLRRSTAVGSDTAFPPSACPPAGRGGMPTHQKKRGVDAR
jgi:hypothetical protein